MAFNQEIHKVKEIIIKCGRALRAAKGMPEEKNISILYEEGSLALGLPTIQTTSGAASQLPKMEDMKDANGKLFIPRRDCERCGEKESVVLLQLCKNCEDSEGGKFKTMWECNKCKGKEKSEKFITQWFKILGIEFREGSKQEMGIDTRVDEGKK